MDQVLRPVNATEGWRDPPDRLLHDHGVARFHDMLSDAGIGLHAGRVVLPPYARAWVA